MMVTTKIWWRVRAPRRRLALRHGHAAWPYVLLCCVALNGALLPALPQAQAPTQAPQRTAPTEDAGTASASLAAALVGGVQYAFAVRSDRAGVLPLAYSAAYAVQRDLPLALAEAAVPGSRNTAGPGAAEVQLAAQAVLGTSGLTPDPLAQASGRVTAVLGSSLAIPLSDAPGPPVVPGTEATSYALRLVDPASGALHLTDQDVSIPARGFPVQVRRTFVPSTRAMGPFGPGWSFDYGARLTFDGTGQPLVQEADGSVTHFALWAAPSTYQALDARQRSTLTLRPVTDALDRQTRLSWDADGRLVALDDPAYGRFAYRYDAAGELVARTDAASGATRYSYDADGNLTTVVDALGHQLRFGYDARDLPVTVTDAAGGTQRISYDGDGRVVSLVDQLGHATRRRYDDAGHQVTAIDAAGGTTRYGYDAAGRLSTVTSPSGHITAYHYDANGLVAETVTPSGPVITRRYDALGRQVAAASGGTTITSQYDALGRRVAEVASDGSGEVLSYDADGRLQRVSTSGSVSGATVTYAVDAVGQAVGVSGAGNTVRYSYDAGGRRVSMTGPTGAVTHYAYDASGRLTRVDDPLGTATFHYDLLGRRDQATLPNAVTARYSYDALNRLTAIVYRRGRTVIAVFGYAYDGAGNVTRETAAGATHRLGYDQLNRLIQVSGPSGTARYAYDAEGNLLSSPSGSGWRYDAAGRLVEANGVTYSYDAAGRLSGASDGTRYRWDGAGHLLSATVKGHTVSYGYDALGRRISRTAAGETTRYAYDDNNPIAVTMPGRSHHWRTVRAMCAPWWRGPARWPRSTMTPTAVLPVVTASRTASPRFPAVPSTPRPDWSTYVPGCTIPSWRASSRPTR